MEEETWTRLGYMDEKGIQERSGYKTGEKRLQEKIRDNESGCIGDKIMQSTVWR